MWRNNEPHHQVTLRSIPKTSAETLILAFADKIFRSTESAISAAMIPIVLYFSTCLDKMENNIDRENWMLPEDFRVYVGEASVINHPAPDYQERILPTINRYRGNDGGYIAIYSRNASQGVYSVGDGIYVIGQIRLQGKYIGRIFHPAGYEEQDISAVQEFKRLADENFAVCQGDCWAGGDTGGWFGIPLEARHAVPLRKSVVQIAENSCK